MACNLKNTDLSGIFSRMDIQSDTAHIELISRYLAAYNAFDIPGMLAVLSPEVCFENYSGGQLTALASGIDEFRRLADESSRLFSERAQRIVALEQGDGSIRASIAYRGRLSVDIPDGPRAGTVLDLTGKSEFCFDGALITKIVDRS